VSAAGEFTWSRMEVCKEVLAGLDEDLIEYLYGGLLEDDVLMARSAAVEFAAPMLEELCGGDESQAEVRAPVEKRRTHTFALGHVADAGRGTHAGTGRPTLGGFEWRGGAGGVGGRQKRASCAGGE
jgi:hypothetical protein